MLFRLDEIQHDEKVEKTVTRDRWEHSVVAGTVVLEDVDATLVLCRRGKQAYEVAYRVSAGAEMTCGRCGDDLETRVSEEGTIAVTDRQPEASHVVLSSGDMDIRFLAEPELDLEHLVLEICELGLPDYPRHESCHGADHADAGAESDETEVASSSPFQVLSEYLER